MRVRSRSRSHRRRRVPGLPLPRCALVALDRKLAELSRGEAAARLRLGQALEVMREREWYAELACSSIGGYVRERCNRPARWGGETMRVARRLAKLPLVRAELAGGRISWSMAELLARHANADDEAAWVAEARRSTFRKLRALVGAAMEEERSARGTAIDGDPDDDEPTCVTLSLTHDEAWTLEAARWLFDKMQPGATKDDFINYVTGEAITSLTELVPSRALAESSERADAEREKAATWRAQLRAWREEAEERVEATLKLGVDDRRPERTWPCSVEGFASAIELDAHIRELAHELVTSDLLLGALAERFWKSDGWRRLGYASEVQYAHERLGVSPATLRVKRALARKSKELRGVAEAIERRRLGCYSALLVVRIATETTVGAWIERAAERTFKMLQEEVDAAELLARMSGERDQWPPGPAELASIARQREQAGRAIDEIDSGAPFASQARTLLRQMSVRSESQTGARPGRIRRRGRVRYRFFVSRATRDALEWFEDAVNAATPWLPEGATLARLLFATFLLIWRKQLGRQVAYAHIYARDGHRCQNPFCDRRDVTPHHIVRRSQGGGDDDENVVSLCTKCHLELLHEIRAIQADPPASNIRWLLGKVPVAMVEGRRKTELAA